MPESENQEISSAPGTEEMALLFPAYDIHSLIACGGMGAVYRATQRSLEREVAIKILLKEFSHDDAFRAGFESEAKAMAKLDHPNLVGVYDFGEIDGMLFIVMEYVHGQSLFHAANGKAVEQGEALRLAAEVCRGLGYAHKQGILHRDIKPANILLDESVHPKIGDFGLARSLESEINKGEQIFGTPGYTAPEVTTPPFSFDHRADIFSVGMILYELLTGKSPINTDGSQRAYQLANLRINSVLKKATHPDPKARYDSAEKLADDLDKIASDSIHDSNQSTTLPSLGPVGALPSAARRSAISKSVASPFAQKSYVKKESSSGTIVVLLLLVISGGVIFVFLKKPGKETETQEARAADLSKEPKVIVIGDPPPAGAESRNRRDARRAISDSPIIPMIVNSGPVIQGGFNAQDFLEKARGVVRVFLASDIRAYEDAVEENARAFQAELKKLAAGWDDDRRQSAEANLSREFEDWRENRYIIPKELPVGFRDSFSIRELHKKFLETQLSLRAPLDRRVSEQTKPYLSGLEYQIDLLKDTDNDTAIRSLEEEIGRIKGDPGYFTSHMFE